MSAALSAAQIAAGVRAGELDPAAVVEDSLTRIAAHNGELNAYCLVLPERARAAAAALAEARERGEQLGPLAGVPVAIKDVAWMAGVPSTDGSRALADHVPDETAAPVERLEAAGAIVVGRSNVPEFCYRGVCANELYGTTANPWDVTTTPGGSSGGAGSAVAAGLCALALGTDGGGSIRIPASFCGVAGIKATFGLVPRGPQWPGWLTMTHVGPMAHSVADCGLMLQAMAGPDARDPLCLPALGRDYAAAALAPDGLRGLRVAVSADLGYVRIERAVRERFAEAVEQLRALGAVVEEAHPGLEAPTELWNVIACADNWASEGPLLATGKVSPDAAELVRAGEALSASEYVNVRNERSRYAVAWGRFMSRYDLMVTPAMELTAFELGRWTPAEIDGEPLGEFYDDWCHFSYPFNLTGQPSMSVPMAPIDGLPIGLQLTGRRFEDDVVLRAAAAWERAQPWERAPQAGVATAAIRPIVGDGPLAPVADAVRAGRDEVQLAGVGAASASCPVRAGELLAVAGRTLRVTRAWSPESDDRLDVSWTVETG